ncbi:MAG: hypothetical protein FIB01_09290 [Gemmatimonadetes bacterium]|nr:hypothetical protein [Gemmatimonadota bacterium]
MGTAYPHSGMKIYLRLLPGFLPLLLACGDGGPSGPATPPVVISTSTLPDGAVGAAYSASLVATGGTGSHAWSLESGTLPAGLSLSVGGAIAGTPTTAGTSAFTVRATSGTASATRGYAINVLPPGIELTTTPLPDGVAGTPSRQTLAAAGPRGRRWHRHVCLEPEFGRPSGRPDSLRPGRDQRHSVGCRHDHLHRAGDQWRQDRHEGPRRHDSRTAAERGHRRPQ